MNLQSFLAAAGTTFDSKNTKLHFATSQGKDNDPLLAFQQKKFKEFQEQQNQKNFGKKSILSLIQLPDKTTWLYAGLYRVKGVNSRAASSETPWLYDTELAPNQEMSLIGRVVVRYEKAFRQSYPEYETCGDDLHLLELRKDRVPFRSFEGYKYVRLAKAELDVVISQSLESWRAALASVKGVYVIVDTSTGKQYVGSATGENGLWQRWSDYSLDGHGGDVELIALLEKEGAAHSRNFQYSILEVCDLDVFKDQILEREKHWKDVLCSREFGLNGN